MNPAKAKRLFFLLSELIINRLSCDKNIFYVTENHDWVIKKIGHSLSKYFYPNFKITIFPYGIRNSIVHHGSVNTFLRKNKARLSHKSNKTIVTWFHVSPGDNRINFVPEYIEHVNFWHTACNLTKEGLIKIGIPEDKIVVIPLGIDSDIFCPPSDDEKKKIKVDLNLPEDKIIIGSFHKDGNGWGEGLEPKLIKGPDIFCDVIEGLSKKYDIHILLTGPARGYVKKRLENAGISYQHHYLINPNELAKYYKALDIYLVTSRTEGGPIAFLEAMATGIPLVTTNVGMANDIIQNGVNGFVARHQGEDLKDEIIALIDQALSCNHTDYQKTARHLSIKYDWKTIAGLYYQKLYKPLLS